MSLSVFDAAREAPDRPALVAAGRVLTWSDAAAHAAGAVRWLAERGVAAARTASEDGDVARSADAAPVALVAESTPEAIAVLLALLALGVPVHLLHPRWTKTEREAVVARIAKAARHEAIVIEAPKSLPRDDREKNSAPRTYAPQTSTPQTSTATVVYTSGTSGTPKGVVLSRGAFEASAAGSAANLGWEDDDRWLLRLPAAHVGGLSIVTRCLIARRCVVLGEAGDEAALLDRIERDRVTLLSLVPTQLVRLLDLEPRRDPPSHLRAVLLGGAAAAPDLLERAADRGWPVLTTYGMSETCSQLTTQPYGTVNRGELGSGRPLEGVEVRIAGPGGEIQARGPTLFDGYFPPGTAPHPFTVDGWFRTGDRGRLDEHGNLHVLGRLDDVIVTGGENVDPLEVETALRGCTGVRDALVFGVPDAEWGERVAALVVAEDATSPPAPDALREELRARLATFKRPRDVAWVDALPLNATGKPDRGAAAAMSGALRPL